MVSKESVKKGFKKIDEWKILNPKSSIDTKLKQSKKLFIDITEIDIRKATLPSLLTFQPKSSVDKLQKWIDKRKRLDDRAESPITIMATIMLSIIIMIGVMFVLGNFMDNFLFIINKLPIGISQPIFQHSMTKLTYLATIMYAIPSIFCATLIVWGVKSVIRKHGYTRTGEEYFVEEF